LDVPKKIYRDKLGSDSAATVLSRFADLTPRERDVLHLLARGYRNGEIADNLVLSPKTIRNYVSRIFSKLGVSSRGEAIVLARDGGFGGEDQPIGTK
jgi:DNA-binding NarL/FixJ family response regulator